MSHYSFNAGTFFFFCLFLLSVFLLGFILFWVVGSLQGQRANRKGWGDEGDWDALRGVKSTKIQWKAEKNEVKRKLSEGQSG